MKGHLGSILLFTLFITLKLNTVIANTTFDHNQKMVKKANEKILDFYDESNDTNINIKVIYFHGNDFNPDRGYKERLTRTLQNVSDFYREEFRRYGININGIPFEKEGDNIKIYTVQGNSPSFGYNIKDQVTIVKEINAKIGNKVDLENSYSLVINGLYYQRIDSTYVFHSPYFGTGFNKGGICMVADCDLLDSKLLTDTIHRMTFTEMMVQNKECHVAEFNSWYIGGIAHELGHVFGLPHNLGHPDELNDTSISLMGEYGSLHYKEYLWNGTKSSFISSASMLILISHPVFTQHNNVIIEDSGFTIKDFDLQWVKDSLYLKASFKTGITPYAAVALVRSKDQSEYFNNSFSSYISENGEVNLNLGNLTQDKYILSYSFIFPDGSKKEYKKFFEVSDKETALFVEESDIKKVDLNELYSRLMKAEKTPLNVAKLDILRGVINPQEPIDPAIYKVNKLYLSDAKWKGAKVGWGEVARNYYSLEHELTVFIILNNVLYKKGLYAHSPSSYIFDINKNWKNFSATIGLRDYAHIQGSAKFTVLGDGKVLYESGVLRVNQVEKIDIDISGVKILELRADPTEGHNHNSWAVWADPLITKYD